eukprot:ANDGO_07073.mRNA.1 hypothetical protein
MTEKRTCLAEVCEYGAAKPGTNDGPGLREIVYILHEFFMKNQISVDGICGDQQQGLQSAEHHNFVWKLHEVYEHVLIRVHLFEEQRDKNFVLHCRRQQP